MPKKHPGAVALGKLRMAKLSPEERKDLSRRAGHASAGIPRPNRRRRAAATT